MLTIGQWDAVKVGDTLWYEGDRVSPVMYGKVVRKTTTDITLQLAPRKDEEAAATVRRNGEMGWGWWPNKRAALAVLVDRELSK